MTDEEEKIMGMNVFVLCTPRSSSYTFAKACTFMSNYTVAHESNSRLLGKKRVVYPENHIEVDNRLAWFLGYLDELYGDHAFYVHLIRNKQKTAISINKRWNLPASIINAYGRAILVRGDRQPNNDLQVCEDYYDTVTKNIQLFLKDKSHKMVFKVENAQENFREFWQKIGAEGNLKLALATWDTKHNASPKNQESIQAKEMKEQALVEISDVRFGVNFPQFIQQEIRGCSLDSPKNGDRFHTYSLQIIGWVVSQKSRVVSVEVVSEGIVLEKVPVDISRPGVTKKFPELPGVQNSGFSIKVGLLGLPMVSELTLQAVLENGSSFPLGTIKLRRFQGLKSPYIPKIQPLTISSVGPSGAEQLLQLLVGHPSLTGIGESGDNIPPSYYWLQLLTEFWSENGIFDAGGHKNLRSKEQQSQLSNLSVWREQIYPENLGSFCLESIDGFYSNLRAKKSEIIYFVESYDASHPKFLNLLSELYPEGKEIILVRDFRDVVYSMLPFSGRKCGEFDPKKFKSYQQFVYQFSKYSVGSLLARWKERSPHVYLVKYEDLILSPEATLRGILQYLSVDSSPEVINTIVKKAWKNHSKPEVLVGDWQYEMPASLQVLCSEVCETALQEFGYSNSQIEHKSNFSELNPSHQVLGIVKESKATTIQEKIVNEKLKITEKKHHQTPQSASMFVQTSDMKINKIFGIGFHKTGTISLGAALIQLGYKCSSGMAIRAPKIKENVYKIAFSRAEKYDAFEDNPWPIIYKELDLKFPNSKFILTLRDTDSWIKSVVNHFGSKKTAMRKWIYGKASPIGNEELYVRRYEQHNQEVIEYFQKRPESLLIMDITKGDGWEKLCPFLDKEIPQVKFPFKNKPVDEKS